MAVKLRRCNDKMIHFPYEISAGTHFKKKYKPGMYYTILYWYILIVSWHKPCMAMDRWHPICLINLGPPTSVGAVRLEMSWVKNHLRRLRVPTVPYTSCSDCWRIEGASCCIGRPCLGCPTCKVVTLVADPSLGILPKSGIELKGISNVEPY